MKEKINNVENQLKLDKENELRSFAEQHIEANNLKNIIKFDDISLNITLSASLKSLKEQILEFVKKVSDDLECISSDENRDEILYEYQHNGFNYQQAVLTIRKKLEEINKLKQQQEVQEEQTKQEEKIVEKVEEVITPPKEIIENDEIITATFTITDTKENIIKVREFMKEEGIKYA